MDNIATASAVVILLACPVSSGAHPVTENGITYLGENRRPLERTLLEVPDIEGYRTVKCDLHMHTVFSDGLVWPTIRVWEAWREGLDAVCITDHIEYQPFAGDIAHDNNRPYQVAEQVAAKNNILLIQGSELTRDTPPGHFNAIFIKDASGFLKDQRAGDLELDREAIKRATDQGAFIFWNHPGWKVRSTEGSYEWIPFVDQLATDGMLHGIEVINGFSFHRKALDWALSRDLAVLGSSDIHDLIEHDYDTRKGVSRSMTLLFVKERSQQGMREALDAGRSVAWSTKLLAGKELWVRALYDASVTVGEPHATDKGEWAYVEVTNNSAFHFDLERADSGTPGWPKSISLSPRKSRVVRIKLGPEDPAARYVVTNAFIGGDTNLEVDLRILR